MITEKLAREAAGRGALMNIGIVGGGPAGLFFAYLMKRQDAAHRIRVVERDPAQATYGWGVVFTDIALAFVRDAAPELYAAMTRNQEVHDTMRIVHRGQAITLANNVFHRMAADRPAADAAPACARISASRSNSAAGSTTLDEFADCDLVVAADGAASTIRTRYRDHFEPTIDVRPNLLAWYGTTCALRSAVADLSRERGRAADRPRVPLQPHAQHVPGRMRPADVSQRRSSTGCRRRTSLAYCARRLPRRPGRRMPLLSNKLGLVPLLHREEPPLALAQRRAAGRRAAHGPSVGRVGHAARDAGRHRAVRRLAERAATTCGALLADFEQRRRPGSDALQAAAVRSTSGTSRSARRSHLDPVSFAYDYLRRTGRVDHEDVSGAIRSLPPRTRRSRYQIVRAGFARPTIWSRLVSTKGFGRPRAFRVETARSASIMRRCAPVQ